VERRYERNLRGNEHHVLQIAILFVPIQSYYLDNDSRILIAPRMFLLGLKHFLSDVKVVFYTGTIWIIKSKRFRIGIKAGI
jgi:hypothetical protein